MFKPISEYKFRELYHKFLFIKGEELLSGIEEVFEIKAEDNGIVVYNYLDYEEGSTFEVLCAAQFKQAGLFRKESIMFGKGNKEVRSVLRKGFVNEFEAMLLDSGSKELEGFSNEINMIASHYSPPNESIFKLRNFEQLDSCRSPDYPDDILVYIFQDGLKPERLWARCYDYQDGYIVSTLLNEPHQNFGKHVGDVIRVATSKQDGEYICFSSL